MNIIKDILRWVFILCFPILLLSASLAICFNSQWMFQYGFEKYNVGITTGLSPQNLDKVAGSWTSYINSDEEYWDITINQDGNTFTLFTHDEQMHFKDVKALVLFDYLVLSFMLVLCFSYILIRLFTRTLKSNRRLAKDIIIAGAVTIGLILVLGIASLFNFDALFLNMHYLLFSNDFWYAEGYMLELFPGGFWYDAAFITIGFMTGLVILFVITAIIYLRSTRKLIQ